MMFGPRRSQRLEALFPAWAARGSLTQLNHWLIDPYSASKSNWRARRGKSMRDNTRPSRNW
jgi:hypothetical protein